jgi:excisionase family DNA binding protein
MQPEPTALLTVPEVATALSLKESTIRRWIAERRLTVIHPGGSRAVRIPRAEIERLIQGWLTPHRRVVGHADLARESA